MRWAHTRSHAISINYLDAPYEGAAILEYATAHTICRAYTTTT